MSKEVAIIGVGMADASKSPIPSWELFAKAAVEAMNDAGVDKSRIQALHLGNVYSAFTEAQINMSLLALCSMGIDSNIPCQRYETACASGSIALRQGYRNMLSAVCTTW